MPATISDLPAAATPDGDLPATGEGPARGARVRSELRSALWRGRHCLVPAAVIAAAGALGGAGQAAREAGPVTGPAVVLVTGAVWAVAGAGVWLGLEWRYRRQGRRHHHRRYRTVVALAGLVWIVWAGLTSAGSWRGAALVAAGSVLAWPFARARSLPIPPPEVPEPPPAPVELHGAAALERDWREQVACPGGAVPGSAINAVDIPEGVQAMVRVVKGTQSVATIKGRIDVIRVALGWPRITVVEDDDDPTLILLTCTKATKQSAAAQVAEIPWDGPRVDRQGRVDLGPYQDGQGVAYYHLLTANGALGGFFAGDPRTGKTEMIANVALSGAAAHLLVPVVVASSPSAAPVEMSDWAWMRAKSAAETDDLLAGLEAGLDYRMAENDHMGWKGFDPRQGRPILGVIVPECHVQFGNKSRRTRFERIGREGAKVGFILLADSQDPTLVAFGSTGPLRTSMGHNYFCTHTKNGEAQHTLGLRGNPTKLPDQPGWAVGGPNCRPEPFRGRYVGDGRYAGIPIPELDTGTAGAIRAAIPGYAARQAIRDAWRSAAVEAGRAGRMPPPEPAGDDLPSLGPAMDTARAAAAAATARADQGRPGRPATTPAAAGGGGGGATLLSFAAPPPMATPPRVPARTQILRALAGGPLIPGDIRARTGLSGKTIYDECTAMTGEGLTADRPSKFAAWVLTDAGRAAARDVA